MISGYVASVHGKEIAGKIVAVATMRRLNLASTSTSQNYAK